MAFFWARCTDMQLISSREAACRSEKPSRTVSRKAVACAAGSCSNSCSSARPAHDDAAPSDTRT